MTNLVPDLSRASDLDNFMDPFTESSPGSTDLDIYKEQIQREIAAAATSISGTRAKISTRNKVFTLPDSTVVQPPMNAIILDWYTAHAYYPKRFTPNSKEFNPPVCWAVGKNPKTLAPHTTVEAPQADSCENCQMNQYGTSSVGAGKACRNARRLVIVPPDFDENSTPLLLETSPTAIKNFDNYVDSLMNMHGVMPFQVVTEINFDAGQTYPVVTFRAVGKIKPERIPGAIKLRDNAVTMATRSS